MDNKKPTFETKATRHAELFDKAIPITAITGMCFLVFLMFGIIIFRSPLLIIIGMSILSVVVLALTGMIVLSIVVDK